MLIPLIGIVLQANYWKTLMVGQPLGSMMLLPACRLLNRVKGAMSSLFLPSDQGRRARPALRRGRKRFADGLGDYCCLILNLKWHYGS